MKHAKIGLIFLLGLSLEALGMQDVMAQQLQRLSVDRTTVPPDQEIAITLESARKGANDTFWCGVLVRFGDGTDRKIRIGENGNADQRLVIRHRYKNPGTYTVSVEPEFIGRGLKSAGGCDGSVPSVSVSVLDPQLEQLRREKDALQREKYFKERQELDRKRQEETSKQRQLELELRRKEAELKQRELELKEKEEKQGKQPSASTENRSPTPSQKGGGDKTKPRNDEKPKSKSKPDEIL